MSPPPEPEGEGSDPLVGKVLADRYRVDELLGEGGMGRVYAVEHVLMRKRLAVKILHRELTSVAEVVARFEREAMAAANIEHPNVAAATDFGKLADGSVYLVLEFVQGRNLRDEIAKGPFLLDRALSIARQIASALQAAHTLDIVHRDLKPENVMLIERGTDPDFVKVLDFGIAKVPMSEQPERGGGKPITKVGMVFGTPEYMSPEQALGQPVDGRADVYALGVILYEMIAGVRPFSSKSPVGILGQQLSSNPPPIHERVPGLSVPPAIDALLQKLLARESSERMLTAADAVSAIDQLFGPDRAGPYKFTIAAGSPPSAPQNPRIGSLPDYPAPVITPIGFNLPSSSSNRIPSAGPVSIPGDPLEADLEPLSVPGMPRPASERFQSLVDRGRGVVSRAADWIDLQRPRWPAAIQTRLANVSARVLLASVAALLLGVVFGLVVVTVVLVGKKVTTPAPSASASGTPAPSASVADSSDAGKRPGAGEEEIKKAEASGLEALAKLSARYPEDGNVLVAMIRVHIKEKQYADAVKSVKSALEVDPGLALDPEIASALWQTVQVRASTDAAFTLLSGPMGAKGADIIYELATTPKVKAEVKLRSSRWLKTDTFQKQSSPALNVLVALENAPGCKQRHALLLRAKNAGDERALNLLQTWQKKDGCGTDKEDDCNPCLREDDVLDKSVDELKKRLGK
jgi:serine/threonine-protein kinase